MYKGFRVSLFYPHVINVIMHDVAFTIVLSFSCVVSAASNRFSFPHCLPFPIFYVFHPPLFVIPNVAALDPA